MTITCFYFNDAGITLVKQEISFKHLDSFGVMFRPFFYFDVVVLY